MTSRWWACGVLGMMAVAAGAQAVNLSVDPAKVSGPVDPKVYGQFLEHIYHSCNGGLWGDLVWNRSFEEAPGAGSWAVDKGELVQTALDSDVRLTFGDAGWGDLEFTVEARKEGGGEGFLLLTRYATDQAFYWLNLGGWGNERHGLERSLRISADRAQRGTVANAAGRIETGRWYRLKVRLEGARQRYWIDDQLVVDYTDDGKGPLKGKVGLGSWNTSVRYRNAKVTDLSGKTLFEGLPPLSSRGLPRHWAASGPGQVSVDGRQPYNGTRCLRLDGEVSISQPNVALVKDSTYIGSLFTRGAGGGALTLSLLDGDKVVVEQRLADPRPEWRQVFFEFSAPATVAGATLRLSLTGQGEAWVDQVSLMPRAWANRGGFRPDLLRAVGELRPPVIRWPGGCYAEHYRWKDGIGPQHRRGRFPISMWDDVDTNSLGTDEFVELCRRVGAEPMLVVNIGRRDLKTPTDAYVQEALEWMEYCNGAPTTKWGAVRAANGHPEPYNVKFWEIDNETWHLGAQAYADYVQLFARAMRGAWPDIKLGVCGSGGYGDGATGLGWNKLLIDQCAPLFDYLSIHHYENPDNFDRGPRAYEAFMARTGDLIAKSANPRAKIFVSEWNAQSTDWRTGLYCGGILAGMERVDAVGMASPALFLRHTSADAWDNSLINFDHTGWFAAPNYVVMKLFWDNFAPQRLALDGAAGPLNAVATLSEDGKWLYLKATNPSDKAVPVTLTVAGGARRAELTLVAPDSLSARNTLAKRDAVKPVSAAVAVQGDNVAFELPRWSVAVLKIRR